MMDVTSKKAIALGEFKRNPRPGSHEFAEHLGVPGYENLSDHPLHLAAERAELILREGWGHGTKYAKIPVELDIPWDDDGPQKRSWNFHVQCWDMCSDLLLAHSVTGDDRFFRVPLKIALDWVAHNPGRDTPGRSQFSWYDMAVGLRAHRLAYIIDIARRRQDVSRESVEALWASLMLHQEYLRDDGNIVFHNNHGFYQVAGQLAMGRRFALESAPMAEAMEQARTRLLEMIATQFTGEGVHREHSPDYHRMVYGSLKGIIAAGLVHDVEILERVRSIEQALAWFVTPATVLVNFGDTDVRSIVRGPREVLRKWSTPEMRFVASGGTAGSPPAETVKAFEESGYFVARDAWGEEGNFADCAYLAQTAAFHSRTHKHADDLSFVWYDKGHDLLVDAGRYGYLGKAEPGSELFEDGYWYSDPNRVYVEATRAHNTVEIDGKNFVRKGAKPYGSAIMRWGTAGSLSFCETEVRQFRSIRHSRTLVFKPGKWLLVFDWLHDNVGQAHDYRQWFHFGPALSVDRTDGRYRAHVPGSEVPLQVVPLTPVEGLSDVIIGRSEAIKQGFYSPGDQQMIPNAAVCFEQTQAASATFATLLVFSDTATVLRADVSRSGRQLGVAWRDDAGENRLNVLRPVEGDMQVEYIQPA